MPARSFEDKTKSPLYLTDEVGTAIRIPTLHIFGCNDAFLASAVALFNVCDPRTAHMYDHGLGHIVPRDAENVDQLGRILQRIILRVPKDVALIDGKEAAGAGADTKEAVVM